MSERQLGATALGIVAVWACVALYAAAPALPHSPIHLPYLLDVRPRTWLPEGWAFFTRDPREAWTWPMAKTTDGWTSASLGPAARLSNVFGLSRRPRVQNIEMGMLLHNVPARAWVACREPITGCLAHAPVLGPFKNPSPHPTLCGTLGFVHQKPLPWAWSHSTDQSVMPATVVAMEATC